MMMPLKDKWARVVDATEPVVNTLQEILTMQFYLDPAREQEPTSLPDGETFELGSNPPLDLMDAVPGWYWQACFPGCLPDGEPNGPFDTEELAIADAQGDSDVILSEGAQCSLGSSVQTDDKGGGA